MRTYEGNSTLTEQVALYRDWIQKVRAEGRSGTEELARFREMEAWSTD